MAVRPLVLIPPVLFAGLAGLFAAGMLREDAQELPSALIGQTAPAAEVGPLGDLPTFDPATLADGELKLVNFWASWCAPCRVEHPHLEALSEEGLPIYGINYKDESANALGFLDEMGNPYTAAGTDQSGRVAVEWGVYGVPETFLVDGEGRILMRMAGPVTERSLEGRLRPALDAAGG